MKMYMLSSVLAVVFLVETLYLLEIKVNFQLNVLFSVVKMHKLVISTINMLMG